MTAELPDRPARHSKEDFLGRFPFARAIADLIMGAPPGGSLRVGIFGGWGEGKTSVMEMMTRELRSHGHKCVWIVPWLAESRDDLVDQVVSGIAKELDISATAIASSRAVSAGAARLREATNSDFRAKVADVVFGPALERVSKRLSARASEKFFVEVDRALKGKRLIVFVDDLDRVDASLLPEALLTLRETLDYPNFYYVLAMAPEIVRAGLGDVNSAFGSTNEFLEKIIELPRYLPKPSDAELRVLTAKLLEQVRGAVNGEIIEELPDLLPRNPRKLKLLLRYLAALDSVVRRFDGDELDVRQFYLVQILRAEFGDEARRMAEDEAVARAFELGLGRLDYEMERQEKGQSEQELAKRFPERRYAPSDPASRERFEKLCEALRQGLPRAHVHTRFDQLFKLADAPPSVTLREVRRFLAENVPTTKPRRRSAVKEFLSEGGSLNASKVGDAFDAALLARQVHLDSAAGEELENDVLEQLRQADIVLDLIREIIGLQAFQKGLLGTDHWERLYAHCGRWAHFTGVEIYSAPRAAEREVLLLTIDQLTDSTRVELYGRQPVEAEDIRGRPLPEFAAVSTQINKALEAAAGEWMLDRFTTPGGVNVFWGQSGSNPHVKDALFEQSFFHTAPEYRSRFYAVADDARSEQDIQLNFLTYFRMLTYAAYEHRGSFPRDGARELLSDLEFAVTVWRAATHAPLNPRTAGSLNVDRLRMQRAGIDVSRLELPRWWKRLEEQGFFKQTLNEYE